MVLERSAAPSVGLWRRFVSVLCVAVATLLVPVSIVAAWTRAELVDEGRFVATLGPLAQNPHVQDLAIDRTTAAIDQSVSFDQITGTVIDGITGLGLPPRAVAALGQLRGPSADGLRNLVDGAVAKVVRSDAFTTTWSDALRGLHRELADTPPVNGDGVLALTDAGLSVRLGPIVAQVKQRLSDQGAGVAALIPAVDRTVVIGNGDTVTAIRLGYRIAVAVGFWLPVVTLALFAIGASVARRRSLAVLWSGLGAALGGAVLAAGIAVGRATIPTEGGNAGAALDAIYGALVGPVAHTAAVVTVLGIFTAVLGWAVGEGTAAGRLRAVVGGLTSTARHGLRERGLDTGRFGAWLAKRRVVVRAVVVVLATVWLVVVAPLSFGDIVLTVVVALLATWALELLHTTTQATS